MQNGGQALNGLPCESKNLIKAARLQRTAEKTGAPKKKTAQSWRGKKFRVDKIKRAEHTRGVDAWRYVKHVAVPLMWPECQCRLQDNPEFVLMEDGVASDSAQYTSRERQKQGI